MTRNLSGTQDYWPEETKKWQILEKTLATAVEQYGYGEVRTPIIEHESVFTKLGADSDVIGKQMYYLKHDSIVLRPEGTSSVMRSGTQHHQITRSAKKIWYQGPMFRHERPQKGRLRQFHQFGAEVFGYKSITIEIEMLSMLFEIFKTLGITNVALEINSIGSKASRQKYKQALLDFLAPHTSNLDTDSQRRMSTNPLRILDSKDIKTQTILKDAPKISDFLTFEEKERLQSLKYGLKELGYSYIHNENLVRGLDYYNDLVFEFTTEQLGAQATVCAGGRYDGLGSDFGHDIDAIGFSIGMERLLELMPYKEDKDSLAIIAFTQVEESKIEFIKLLKTLRNLWQGQIIMDHSDSNFNNKYKRALKQDPICVITVDEENWKNNTISIRFPEKPVIEIAWDAREIIKLCQ